MRAVLDTDVLVAAFRSASGASRWLLHSALRHKFTVVVSVPLMLEYEAVLTRPEQLAASGLSVKQVNSVLAALAAVANPVRLSFRWRPLLADAGDDMVMETALNGGAQLVVTFNLRDFGSAGEPFGCRVVLPREAVTIIRKARK